MLLLLLCLVSFGATAAGLEGSSHAVVMQYHHVSTSTPAVTSIAPRDFAAHLDYLARNNFHVLPLETLVSNARAGIPMPERTVAISFDDGYLNIATNAHPLLRKHQYPYTLFVVFDHVGSNPRLYLSWEQILRLSREGASIANHSFDHGHLTQLRAGESPEAWRLRIRENLMRVERELEQRIGHSPRLLAYPYGEYNDALRGIVRELGLTAFGQQSGAIGPGSDFLALPRFPLEGSYADLRELGVKLRSEPMPLVSALPDPEIDPGGPDPEWVIELAPTLKSPGDLTCFASGQGRIAVTKTSSHRFVVRAKSQLPKGRSRFNCTMPTAKGNFFWISQPWIKGPTSD